jgi:hypothetical protein
MDQLRTFIATADEGSFSAAGRKLRPMAGGFHIRPLPTTYNLYNSY